MKVYVSFDIFDRTANASMVSGDIDLPELPKVGDWVDIRSGNPPLMDSVMPATLEVTSVSLVLHPDGTTTDIVAFEYFDVGAVEAKLELCRLLERELDLFCEQLGQDEPEDEADA